MGLAKISLNVVSPVTVSTHRADRGGETVGAAVEGS
jgi:hypothetical protein